MLIKDTHLKSSIAFGPGIQLSLWTLVQSQVLFAVSVNQVSEH